MALVEEAAEVLDRVDRVDEVIKMCRELGLEREKAPITSDIPRWFLWPEGGPAMKWFARCDNCHWVCEGHPARADGQIVFLTVSQTDPAPRY
jgi:hypothetical protein